MGFNLGGSHGFTSLIRYDLKDLGRQFTGQPRNFNVRAICDAINSLTPQELMYAVEDDRLVVMVMSVDKCEDSTVYKSAVQRVAQTVAALAKLAKD